MTDQQSPIYPLSVHDCSWVSELPLPRPPSEILLIAIWNQDTLLARSQCGLIWNSLTWPQRLAMNRGIIFGISQHYYPEELIILKVLGTDFDIRGNHCCQVVNITKSYFLTGFPKVLEASNPDAVLSLRSTVQDSINPPCANSFVTRFVQEFLCHLQLELKRTGDERGQWSGFTPGNWLMGAVKAQLWQNHIYRRTPQIHSTCVYSYLVTTNICIVNTLFINLLC